MYILMSIDFHAKYFMSLKVNLNISNASHSIMSKFLFLLCKRN